MKRGVSHHLAGLIALAALLHAASARADCPAAPIGNANDMAISFLAANGVQASSAALLASAVKEGTLVYDDTVNTLKICDGTNWIGVGSGGGGGTPAGTVAGAIQFRGSTAVFAADDANLVWDDTNKRLGIGTATPTAPLHVIGNANFGGTNPRLDLYAVAPGNYYLERNGTATTLAGVNIVLNPTSGLLDIRSAGNPFIRINTTSQMIMGGTTPHASAILELASSARGLLPPRMTTTQRNAISSPATGLVVFDTDSNALFIRTSSSWSALGSGSTVYVTQGLTWNPANLPASTTLSQGDLRVAPSTYGGNNWRKVHATESTGNSGKYYFEGVAITASGIGNNLGIGFDVTTNTPAQTNTMTHGTPYSISGGSIANGGVIMVAIDIGAGKFWYGKNGVWNGTGNPATGANPDGTFTAGTAYYPAAYVGISSDNANISSIQARFLPASWSYAAPSGFGALGTAASLNAAGTVAGAVQFRGPSGGFAADSTNLIWDDTNKRLGIGSTSPQQLLHLASSAAADRMIRFSNSLNATGLDIGVSAGAAGGYIWQRDNTVLSFGTNNAERMRIDATGNVGIGTTNPEHKLVVQTATGPNLEGMRVISGSTAAVWLAPHVTVGNWNGITQTGDQGIFFQGSTGVGTGNLVIAPWAAATSGIRITSAGNVGIGTASPSRPLDVTGIIQSSSGFISTAQGYNTVLSADANGSYLEAQGANNLRLFTNSAERLRVNSTGNVGIGTTAPGFKLAVKGDETNDLVAINADDGAIQINRQGGDAYIDFANNIGDDFDARIQNKSDGLFFSTGGNGTAPERVVITSSGNVGIGTTSPANLLTVGAGTGQTNALIAARRPTGGAPNAFEWGHTNAGGYGSTLGALGGSGQPFIGLNAEGGTTSNTFRTRGIIGRIISTDLAGSLLIGRAATANADNQAFTEDMRIDAAGRVGIGTTSAAAPLHVAGAAASGETLRLSNGAGGEGGQITLMDGTGAGGWEIDNNGTGASAMLRIFRDKGVNNLLSGVAIAPSGNVGIGTATPSYTLHVEGTAYAAGAAGALSDMRHKKNITTLADGALDKVLRLRPVSFEWKTPKDDGMKGEQFGFIAQEIETVLPQVVLTQSDKDKTKGLKPTELIPILTKAVQELKADNDNLRAELNAANDNYDELRREIDALKATR